MGVDVRAPDGRTWTVRRRLRWPRWRKPDLNWTDVPLITVDDPGGLVVAVIIAVVGGIAVAILVFLFLPLVVFLVEGFVAVVAAMLLGRRWLVVASTLGPPAEERKWQVRGFLASRRAIDEVARELRSGLDAAPKDAVG